MGSLAKNSLKRIHRNLYRPTRHWLSRKALPLRRRFYQSFDLNAFLENLRKLELHRGDSVFVMCSPDQIYLKTGYHLPVHLLLDQLLTYLGKEGTVLALGYCAYRKDVISGKRPFDVRRGPTLNGMFSDLLLRKTGAVRSLHPTHSAIALGKRSEHYCGTHHLSPFGFDEKSPYYRLTQDGGKYLGIGLGVESFSAGHMIDDHFKLDYKHKIFVGPKRLQVIDSKGQNRTVEIYLRKNIRGFETPRHHFRRLRVESRRAQGPDGVTLFSMPMKPYLDSAIELYEKEGITIWSPGLPRWLEQLGRAYTWAKRTL